MAAGHYPTQGSEAQIADEYQASADVTLRARMRVEPYMTHHVQNVHGIKGMPRPARTPIRPVHWGPNCRSSSQFLFQQSSLPHLCLVLPSFAPLRRSCGIRNLFGSSFPSWPSLSLRACAYQPAIRLEHLPKAKDKRRKGFPTHSAREHVHD